MFPPQRKMSFRPFPIIHHAFQESRSRRGHYGFYHVSFGEAHYLPDTSQYSIFTYKTGIFTFERGGFWFKR
jgi:hypothetical protein